MNNNEYSMKVTLRKKNIKELRVMARGIGVSSPTSKQKEELIAEIVDIMEGKLIPDYKNVNRGRPTKAVQFDASGAVEYPTSVKSFEYSQKVASPSQEYVISRVDDTILGVICHEDGHYYLRRLRYVKSAADKELPLEFIKKYGLEDGDLVEYTKNGTSIELKKINNADINVKYTSNTNKTPSKSAKSVVFLKNNDEILQMLIDLSRQGKVVFFSNKNLLENNPSIITINQFSSEKNYFSQFMSQILLAKSLIQMQEISYFVFDNISNVFDELLQMDNNYSSKAQEELSLQLQLLKADSKQNIFILSKNQKEYQRLISILN